MPEPLLLLAALVVAGAAVLHPVFREGRGIGAGEADEAGDERRAAALRHRVALESLRDVEADRRAGSLDDDAYARLLAEAEARAAATRAALDAEPPRPPSPAAPVARAVPASVALVIGAVLVAGSLVPAAGIGNATVVNEALAAAEAEERARQARIGELTAALARDPRDVEVVSELADAYLAGSTGEDLVAAARALQLLIALEPQRPDAYERIVTAYVRADDYVNARAALDSYGRLDGADPVEVAFLDGLIALRGEDDAERARDAFSRFLELAPDDPRVPMVESLAAEAGTTE